MIDVDELVASVRTLAPFPQSSARIVSLLSAPTFEVGAVTDVIERDPALTATLLKLANSAMYAASSPIATVRSAVVRLGSGPVLLLAVSAATSRALKEPLPAYDLAAGDLWKRAVTTSTSAELIGRHARGVLPPETTTVALLLDIGKILLAPFLGDEVLDALREESAHPDGAFDWRAEQAVLSVHHAEIGARMARQWDLPATIVEGIRLQHQPGVAPVRAPDAVPGVHPSEFARLCDVVHVAGALGHRLAADADRRGLDDLGVDPEALRRLDLDDAALGAVAEEVEQKTHDLL